MHGDLGVDGDEGVVAGLDGAADARLGRFDASTGFSEEVDLPGGVEEGVIEILHLGDLDGEGEGAREPNGGDGAECGVGAWMAKTGPFLLK